MALLVAACGAALVSVAAAAVVLVRGDADRRRQALLIELADDLGTATRRIARALDRVTGARPRGLHAVGSAPLTLAQVMEDSLAAALERSGADAAAARVERLPGAPVTVVWGDGVDSDLLDSTLTAAGPGAFRAATVRWTYQSMGSPGGHFRTATVVPIVEDERVTGALVAFASSDSALGPTDERALRSVADEAATRLESARRYEELDRRYLTDPGTGMRNRAAYETDLERAVARSRERARPLSVVLLEIGPSIDGAVPDRESSVLADVARVVSQISRGDDVVYRRRDRQLAILLRGAGSTGATAMAARVHAGACSALTERETVAVAAVHWRASESADSLDERAAAALEAAVRTLAAGEGARSRS